MARTLTLTAVVEHGALRRVAPRAAAQRASLDVVPRRLVGHDAIASGAATAVQRRNERRSAAMDLASLVGQDVPVLTARATGACESPSTIHATAIRLSSRPGRLELARRFNAGKWTTSAPSPEGTAGTCGLLGLCPLCNLCVP